MAGNSFVGQRTAKVVIYIALVFFSLMALFPVYFSFSNGFKTPAEFVENKIGLPSEWTGENWNYVVDRVGLPRYLRNNAIVIPIGLAVYLAICSAAGFAFGSLRFRGKLAIFTFILFLMIFPQMIISVPVYILAVRMGLVNTFAGLIIVWVAYFAPFGTYIMTTYFSSIPRSLIESARMDGANVFQILIWLMIPIALPMLATITIIGFQAMWNELPFSLLLLQQQGKRTLTLGIALMKGEHGLPVPIIAAALAFASVVPLVIFLFFQRYVAGGATAGAMKY
ncbi:MAG: carbohydrate ABC transporter permease [Spirochaetota bacterium]